jgi:hypothetical protein
MAELEGMRDVPELLIFRIADRATVDEYYYKVELRDTAQTRGEEYVLRANVTRARNQAKRLTIIKRAMEYIGRVGQMAPADALVRMREIGSEIYATLGLRSVFDWLWSIEQADSLIVATNDHEIPWQWVTNELGQMLAERFSIGYVVLQNDTDWDGVSADTPVDSADPSSGSRFRFYESFEQVRSEAVLVIAGDTCEGECGLEVSNVQHERESIKEKFLSAGFREGNVVVLEGEKSEELHIDFHRVFHEHDEISIIHYAGQFTEHGEILYRRGQGKITPELVKDMRPKKSVLLNRNSLVFLNGCSSVPANHVYGQLSQLCSTFRRIGATLCIVPAFPVQGLSGLVYASVFYEVLLDHDSYGKPISHVLRRTRELFPERYLKRIKPSNRDRCAGVAQVLPYFYRLYGNPALPVFPSEDKLDAEFDWERQRHL